MDELPEKYKQMLAEETALFISKTGVRVEDALAFATRISLITSEYMSDSDSGNDSDDLLINLRTAKYLNPECFEHGCQWLKTP